MGQVVELGAAPDPAFIAGVRKVADVLRRLSAGASPERAARIKAKLDRIDARLDRMEAQACRLQSR